MRLPDDGLWLTRYVSSLICDGDSEFLYPMGVVSDFGYIDLQSGKMQYFLRDHLGSVRVIAEDRHTVISRTDYLPFGVRMSGDGLTVGNPSARSSFFGFSGKENEMWGGYDTPTATLLRTGSRANATSTSVHVPTTPSAASSCRWTR